jgi:hypothetical protein
MKLMTKLLTAIFLCLTLLSCGQTKQTLDKDKGRIDKVCDNFMQQFVAGKTDEALELLKQNTVMEPSTIDTLKVTVADHAKNLFPRFGKMISYDFVKEKMVENYIAKRFYIIKFSKFFLKVDFTLYNNGTGWTVTSFHYNEEVEDLFQ